MLLPWKLGVLFLQLIQATKIENYDDRSLGNRETETSAVKMGKDNKEHKESKESKTVDNYEARMPAVLPFAKPLASKKLNKKVLKTVKKASKAKNVKRGVKEVVKALRKGEKGLVVIAGDISPADVISHIPVLCEDRSRPFSHRRMCYLPIYSRCFFSIPCFDGLFLCQSHT